MNKYVSIDFWATLYMKKNHVTLHKKYDWKNMNSYWNVKEKLVHSLDEKICTIPHTQENLKQSWSFLLRFYHIKKNDYAETILYSSNSSGQLLAVTFIFAVFIEALSFIAISYNVWRYLRDANLRRMYQAPVVQLLAPSWESLFPRGA